MEPTFIFTIASTNEEVQIHRSEITAGRGDYCDFIFDKKHIMIARAHAKFFYKDGSWFVMDNYSTNGVWLNDERIESGKLYSLTAGDVIDFAHSEKFIF